MHSLRWTAVLGGICVLGTAGALAVACGGSDSAQCDPTTDPTCVSPGDDSGSVPDGVTVLPDGGWLLPDGSVVPPGTDVGTGSDGTPPPPDGVVGDGVSPDGVVTDGGPGAPGCISDNGACSSDAACCGGKCTSGKCAPLSATCKTLGNACGAGSECCSTFCSKGVCSNPSYCVQTGDACASAASCCSGNCNIPTGSLYGTCGAPPTGPTYCSGVDGTVCTDCTTCCSRVCAPYGLTGVSICQPAEGCHVVGDLCRKDTDCCGAAGTGLPGDGHVTCEIAAGATIGICRNPLACNPEGAVCHYKSAAVCGTSSARDDCCDGLGAKSGVCRPDSFGVPRCYGGEPCHKAGEACADSSGCCDGTPCVPDSTGVLRCSATKCVPVTGPCTTDADCCVGSACHVPLGSTSGTCGSITPPPPPPGTDAGTTDTSVPPTDATGSDTTGTDTTGTDTTPPPPTCSLYGQACNTNGDCCSGVPCTSPAGIPCASGVTGCTCHNAIK